MLDDPTNIRLPSISEWMPGKRAIGYTHKGLLYSTGAGHPDTKQTFTTTPRRPHPSLEGKSGLLDFVGRAALEELAHQCAAAAVPRL
ncbi:hypothetical protein PC9H_005740 [Pleurotus ostreatus]|uniref:Uncharacterized protein n=1 Tax=Pleurotus ostreatus TaxID=5322 RepID=A0A8H6ZXP0_PLEOS|nr:uncharacterized protein PC9H_005740 [Pleurotus ostreatus]KAF7433775.1 hypothetical protein PC9H_005740 [Pleurotus ostreatus]KAJ8697435.1 hypothetical protein PTI98_004243 [Pleurotus ostreatus]